MTNLQQRSYHVIIPAAGSGQRMGEDTPKQYIKIAGKAVLRHTLDNVLTWPGLGSVHVIIDPTHADLYHDAVTGLDLPGVIDGGKDRKQSVFNALNHLSNLNDKDIVLIHDAARPFVKWNDVQALLSDLNDHQAASLATPVSDTLRRDGDIVERDGLFALQTPQAFRYADLKRAHEAADADTVYTDDTRLVSAIGIDVAMTSGSRLNFKITTKDDLKMAQALLSQDMEVRTGLGFDVHAFDDEAMQKPLILCGVELEHSAPLKGHSDADVGLHAITDAILGAIGEGDIGQHFPPSDDTFKDMDSAIFLEKARDMLTTKGGMIQNIDVTLICEAPKIGPHSAAMKTRIADILNIAETTINVKATTTEQLGFTGRREGIAAQSIATVKVPSC